ncbi:UNVERIFIED_CONTAM: hypothetical protein RMT77_015834 [Armadillidium vulgare]
MDTDNDPYYNRRLRGTPSLKFTIKIAAIITGASIVVGIGTYFITKALVPPKGKEPTIADKLREKMRAHRNRVSPGLMGKTLLIKDYPDENDVEK